jgi:hypothetical protein
LLVSLVLIGCGLRSFNISEAGVVVAKIQDGSLAQYPDGVVRLPAEHASLSLKEEVYVTAFQDGTIAVLFTHWRGKGRNFRGHLFTSSTNRITSSDTLKLHIRDPAQGNAIAEVWAHVGNAIDTNWYEASYSLD